MNRYSKKVRQNKGKSLTHFVDHYIVVDIETTGFAYGSADILEICAKKYVNAVFTDAFICLVKPRGPIPYFITELTGIDDRMVIDALSPHDALSQFHNFIGESILVAHNANFDIDFLYDASQNVLGRSLRNDFIDTLRLSRRLVPSAANHKLATLASHFNIASPNHRAEQDVDVTNTLYNLMRTIER